MNRQMEEKVVQMAEITTIIFDIGNVLIDFRWKEYLKECNYSEEMVRRVSKATVKNPLWRLWDRGDIEVTAMIEQCCKEEPEAENEIRRLFADLTSLIREFDYSASLIRKLKENGYSVYLLSNYPKYFYEQSKKMLSFLSYVDGGIISYEINHVKPEPEIYAALIDKYHFNPKEAVFLDDLTENLETANQLGFHTIQVKSYDQMLMEFGRLRVVTA